MSRMLNLFDVGIGLLVSGFLIHLFDDVLYTHVIGYVVDVSNPYYSLSCTFWDLVKFIVFFLGVVLLVVGVATSHKEVE